MTRISTITKEQILNESKELFDKVAEYLKAYDECFITYENGKYSFGCCIKSNYSADHRVLGTILADDFYTPEERMENYMNEFHDYPIEYKGKRDYRAKKQYEETHKGTWNLHLIEGNFEFI